MFLTKNSKAASIIALSFTLMFGVAYSQKPIELGEIKRIITNSNNYSIGDTIQVHIEIRNISSRSQHYLVALNIYRGDRTIYDSHRAKEEQQHKGDDCIEVIIKPRNTSRVGPFTYVIPPRTKKGVYEVLAGLRIYPWEPVIEFRGASWAPPRRTIRIK